MTVKDVFGLVVAVVITLIAAWEVRQLAKRPRDPGLRVLAPGLVLLAVTLILAVQLWPLTLIGSFQDEILLGNVIWIAMSWCYATFFVVADRGRDPASRRRWIRRSAAAVVAAIALDYAALVIIKLTGAHGAAHTAVQETANVALYGCSFVLYALGSRFALRYLRRVDNRWLRTAIVFVVVGAGGMTLGVDVITLLRHLVLNFVLPGQKLPWLTDLYNVGRLGGQFLLALGLALAPLGSLAVGVQSRRDARRRRRYERALRPMWQRLTAEFPYLVLDPANAEPPFDRTVVEITDALARLSAFVPDTDDAAPHAGNPTRAATLVVRALAARAAAQSSAGDPDAAWTEPPYPRIEPDFGADWDARARWMTDLAAELQQRGELGDDVVEAPERRGQGLLANSSARRRPSG